MIRHLSEDAVKRLSDDGQITDFRELLKKALDVSIANRQLENTRDATSTTDK